MKRFLIFLMLLPTVASAQFTGDTYAQARSKGSATWVYTYSEAPGFAARSADGKMAGICPDIMDKFAQYIKENEGIDITVEYQMANSQDFPKFLENVRLSKGGVFGLSNTTITEERKQNYNFSPPYITNIGMILTHNSVPTVNNISEIGEKFQGMAAVTVKNSTNEHQILEIKKKYYPSLPIKYVSSFMEAMDVITKDPKTFTNIDFTYFFEAMKNRLPVKRHPGGDNQTEEFGIIMPKSNDWVPHIDKFMASFAGSTEYKKIISDNLGSSAIKFFDSLK